MPSDGPCLHLALSVENFGTDAVGYARRGRHGGITRQT